MSQNYAMPPLTPEEAQQVIDMCESTLSMHAPHTIYAKQAMITLAALTAEPIGKVFKGEVSDSNEYPDARVSCLHDQADWENFKDGYQLYDAPPVPVVKAVSLPKAKGPQFVYHGGKGAFDAGKDAGFNEALLLCTEALYAAGYEVKP